MSSQRRPPARRILRRTASPGALAQLPASLHPVLRGVLASRAVTEQERTPALSALIPVSTLPGCAAAALRLLGARQRGERVLVLGDFDADGATATALMLRCLRGFGFANVDYLIPDRFVAGYGLSPAIVDVAAARNPALLITVDNGITSLAGTERARAHGIEVMITDHHLAGAQLPAAEWIINPNLPGAEFASRNLCGVGVAFYLMAVLARQLASAGFGEFARLQRQVLDCLDLVALGTVADMVTLDFNNRILVAEGLRRIRAGRAAPGIAALFHVAGREPARAQASDLGFAVAPRLNAAGRLEDMRIGVECLLADEPAQARALAGQLDALNAERRSLQAEMVGQAEALLAGEALPEAGDSAALCLYDEQWHQGVVGLVATRIREQTGKPVIAFAPDQQAGLLRGSARSVPGLNIRDALAEALRDIDDPVIRFGGHAMAAGITLPAQYLEVFSERLMAAVAAARDPAAEPGLILSDGPLAPADLGMELASALRAAGPWGQGFPEPLFDNEFVVLEQRVVGERHLRLGLAHPEGGDPLPAIAFNQPPLPDTGAPVHCAYRLDLNWYRERCSHQLVVEHIDCD